MAMLLRCGRCWSQPVQHRPHYGCCLPAERRTTHGRPPTTRAGSARCMARRGTDPTAMHWTSRRTRVRSASARTLTRSSRPAARSWLLSSAERTGRTAVMPDRSTTCQPRSDACPAAHKMYMRGPFADWLLSPCRSSRGSYSCLAARRVRTTSGRLPHLAGSSRIDDRAPSCEQTICDCN